MFRAPLGIESRHATKYFVMLIESTCNQVNQYGGYTGMVPNEPAEFAMQKAEVMIHDYVKAGFVKIHLDCSMSLADYPAGGLDVEVATMRAARVSMKKLSV